MSVLLLLQALLLVLLLLLLLLGKHDHSIGLTHNSNRVAKFWQLPAS
jgi:hypothetical protein